MGGKSLIQCQKCGKSIPEEKGLVHTDIETKQKHVICENCFKSEVGVDYKTFQMRRENAKQGCLATIVSLIVTVYAFLEYGYLYGLAGIVLTGLIYYFSAKVK